MDDPGQLDENSQASQTITPPSISLPEGGGAIRGIGEKFAANPSTGIGSNTIAVSPSHGCSNVSPSTYVLTIQALVIAFMGLV